MTEIQIHKIKGQNSRLIIGNTPHSKNYIYIYFLKRKFNAIWENFNKGEGVIIKIRLRYLKEIINVLRDQAISFILKNKKENYKITLSWEGSYIKINIMDYIINMNLDTFEKFRRLLLQIYEKKMNSDKTNPVDDPKLRKKMYRQGDVLLRQVDYIPPDLTQRRSNVVLEGEVTGHCHAIENGAVYELLFSQADQFEKLTAGRKVFIKTNKNARIVHDEHLPIELEPGLYEMVRQKEYLGVGQRRIERFVRD